MLVGILRTGAPGLQFATGIAPQVVDLLLAIILLMVSIPVLGKWIFRSRADQGHYRLDELGVTDMGYWIAKNRTTVIVSVAVIVAAYAFYYLKNDIAPCTSRHGIRVLV